MTIGRGWYYFFCFSNTKDSTIAVVAGSTSSSVFLLVVEIRLVIAVIRTIVKVVIIEKYLLGIHYFVLVGQFLFFS